MARKKSEEPKIPTDNELVLTAVRECRREAGEARRDRLKRNKRNWDVYHARQDWSYKQEGQSIEFLPKMAMAAEQMAAFVKRALVQFGDWFSVEYSQDKAVLTPEQCRTLLRRFLERVYVARNQTANISTIMSDAVKQGLHESLIILKVHGTYMTERTFKVEPGAAIIGEEDKLKSVETEVWRLRIDLIPGEDFYQDPTGRNLYRIHRVERDYFDVLADAKRGLYDRKAVEELGDVMERDFQEKRQAVHRGQNEATPPQFRRRVLLDEFWGTILGPDGEPVAENIVCTVANDKVVIRKPEPYPFWHGEDPFVVAPIVRVPHSTLHKALFDHAASLNLAINEIFNLILDGAISSVWGVRQVREDALADPRQISNGVPQNATLLLADGAPPDIKAVEAVVTGRVPAEAVGMLNLVDRELQNAELTNDTRLGNLPPRAVKATEIVETQQSQAVVLDAFAGDIEHEIMEPMLRKCWFCILQYMDDLPAQDLVEALGVKAAYSLANMSAAKRFAAYSGTFRFRVLGLSGTLARSRDFQKLMALMQGVAGNPILMEAFMRRISADKTLDFVMKSLNINPESLQPTDEEKADAQNRMQRMATLQRMVPPGGGTPPAPGGGGGPEAQGGMPAMQSEIAQGAEPTSGF